MLEPGSKDYKGLYPFSSCYAILLSHLASSCRNPGAWTVEDELEKILLNVGLIEEKDAGNFTAVGWNRAARTDKGVHAAWQVVSLRMRIAKGEEDEWAKKCNQVAPDDMKVFAFIRVTKLFNSKNFCSGRRYGYLLPTFLLEPRRRTFFVSRTPVLPACMKSLWAKRSGIPAPGETIPGLSPEVIADDPYCNGNAFAKAREEMRQLRIAQAEAQRQAQAASNDPGSCSGPNGSVAAHYVSPVIKNSTYALSLANVPSHTISELDAYQLGDAFVKGRQELKDALASAAEDYRTHGFRLGKDQLALLQRTLRRYKGTHAYHNFTPRLVAGDATTVRYVVDCHVSQPMLLPNEFSKSFSFHPPRELLVGGRTPGASDTAVQGDTVMGNTDATQAEEESTEVPIMEYVHITIIGQSFLLNQIRHMVGLAVDITRGAAPELAMDLAFSAGSLNVPLAPAEGLYLDACFFEAYDRRFAKKNGHPSMTRLPAYNIALMKDFRETVIWPHMVRTVWQSKPFHSFIGGLNSTPFTYKIRADARTTQLLAEANAKKASNRKRGRDEVETPDADSVSMAQILQPAVKSLVLDGAALSRVAREKSEFKKKIKEEKDKLREAAYAKWEERWNKKHVTAEDKENADESDAEVARSSKGKFFGWRGRGRKNSDGSASKRLQTWKPKK